MHYPLIKIDALLPGEFRARPNRYLADVVIQGVEERVHVHDPGRLKELLYPGNQCLVKYAKSDTRKTDWDMIAAAKDGEYVMVHSGYHRYIAEAILRNEALNPFGSFQNIKPEAKYGHSRIDFYATEVEEGRQIWVEVKGCSLSVDGLAQFPDAPTVRGVRHLEELIQIVESGDRAGVLILILSEANLFEPKRDTDPKFYETFYRAKRMGVEMMPVKVRLKEDGFIYYEGIVPIKDEKDE